MHGSLVGLRSFSALVGLFGYLAVPVCAELGNDNHFKPVAAVGDKQFGVTAAEGSGMLRYFSSGSLDGDAHVTRAFIIVHGLLRNADGYERTGEAAITAANEGANTVLIAPHFLTEIDVKEHGLPPDTLRWRRETWVDGYPAEAPAPLSAFSALDAIVLRLADRTRFPALREIVLAGHSAGGQLVQRYAAVGRAPDALATRSLAMRFVVANPSSYLYFDAERPHGDGFAAFDGAACPHFNRWKYGVEDPPAYVTGSFAELETRFVARDVTYLLGRLDNDPNHPLLDKSCAAESQGPYRLERGRSYVRYLRRRHPSGTAQSTAEVAGVDHDARGMFTSPCGVAVLFGRPRTSCAGAERI